jgi:hypothetical protein
LKKILTSFVLTGIVGIALSGCSTAQPSEDTPEGPEPTVFEESAPTLDQLSQSDSETAVQVLDNLPEDKRPDYSAIVKGGDISFIKFDSDHSEFTLHSFSDSVLLSIAPALEKSSEACTPYRDITYESGAMKNTDVSVKLSQNGIEIFDDPSAATSDSGYLSYWIDKGDNYTVEVTVDGKTGSQNFSTNDSLNFCNFVVS